MNNTRLNTCGPADTCDKIVIILSASSNERWAVRQKKSSVRFSDNWANQEKTGSGNQN